MKSVRSNNRCPPHRFSMEGEINAAREILEEMVAPAILLHKGTHSSVYRAVLIMTSLAPLLRDGVENPAADFTKVPTLSICCGFCCFCLWLLSLCRATQNNTGITPHHAKPHTTHEYITVRKVWRSSPRFPIPESNQCHPSSISITLTLCPGQGWFSLLGLSLIPMPLILMPNKYAYTYAYTNTQTHTSTPHDDTSAPAHARLSFDATQARGGQALS